MITCPKQWFVVGPDAHSKCHLTCYNADYEEGGPCGNVEERKKCGRIKKANRIQSHVAADLNGSEKKRNRAKKRMRATTFFLLLAPFRLWLELVVATRVSTFLHRLTISRCSYGKQYHFYLRIDRGTKALQSFTPYFVLAFVLDVA